MDLKILKKKFDGYRAGNGSFKNVPPELLLELRYTWEHYTGSPEEFRSELGVKIGTLRRFLVESKKLNHVLASAGAVEIMASTHDGGVSSDGQDQAIQYQNNELPLSTLEMVYDRGAKVIRFPNVDVLVDFLRKSA